jgi:vancomycin resistance protein VanJ
MLSGLYAGGLLVMSATHLLAPVRDGFLALTQVFAPHLFLPLVGLLPLGLRYGGSVVRGLLVAAVTLGLLRFAGGVVSLPQGSTPDARPLKIMSWNVATGATQGELVVDRLLASDAELVGLQELRVSHVRAIEAEPLLGERFPYRVLQPHDTVLGMGLLSAHPIVDHRSSFEPPYIAATVELAESGSLRAVTAHPQPARMGLLGGLVPLRFETAERDASLRAIRQLLEPGLAAGEPVVLLGDFNVTDREPAYAELSTGLSDAHLVAGLGTGSTWRPPEIDFLPFGILRIDYIFGGGRARPVSVDVDCPSGTGDHCIISGVIEILPGNR